MSALNDNIFVQESEKGLYNWTKSENYCGWDIYDALNSELVQKICMDQKPLQIIATQFNKYSPINFRPVLKVEKGVDMKGLALFTQSFSKMYRISEDEKYKEDILNAIEIFKKESVRSTYNYDCWAHYFNYTSADKNVLSPKVPDVITTSNVIKSLVDSYFILEREDVKEMSESAYNFMVSYLLKQTDDGQSYLMYSPLDKDKVVINASALGLEAISRLMYLLENDKQMKEIARNLCDLIIKTQRSDGSWVYSKYHNGKERVQTDFHQGFILDGLIEYLPFAAPDQKEILFQTIQKGVDFYRNKQFLEDGRCHFRYPRFYPTDTHSQAQGIITFSKYSLYEPEYLDFAGKIARWTISNMQDDSGYFYYYKHRFFTNRIPHMRWCQAWMMVALSTYLEQSERVKCQGY